MAQEMVKLYSADRQPFEMTQEEAFESQTVKNMIEDTGTEDMVPLPNVSGRILARVVEYCKFHVKASKTTTTKEKEDEEDRRRAEEDVGAWDAKFLDDVDQSTLFELILAANYLNIKSLLDLTCQRVAQMIKGKTTEEIRQLFNIKNDFTPEEEEEVRRENQWAFD